MDKFRHRICQDDFPVIDGGVRDVTNKEMKKTVNEKDPSNYHEVAAYSKKTSDKIVERLSEECLYRQPLMDGELFGYVIETDDDEN